MTDDRVDILYSCHPRSRNRLEKMKAEGKFELDPRVIQHEPLGFHDYNCLQMNALQDALQREGYSAGMMRIYRDPSYGSQRFQRLHRNDLWQGEGYTFSTSGRGKKPGVKFKYSVSRSGGAAGRKYGGTSVEGFGNEMWIAGKEKSISRSTVDLAFRHTRECDITGPKKLGVPGADSYLFPVFVRFGVIG